MNILIRAAFLLAAGAAGWAMARRTKRPTENAVDPHVVYLSDDDAVIDGVRKDEAVPARVVHCVRRMDPITLNSAGDVSFELADGTEVRLFVIGEGGYHLQEGDTGLLTWSGDKLVCFAKDNGELVGDHVYAPAAMEDETHE